MLSTRICFYLVLSPLVAACGDGDEAEDIDAAPPGPAVDEFLADGCSTSVVLGLSLEIADEIACMDPDALGVFASSDSIVFASSAVLPYLAPSASSDLESAVLAGVDSVGEPLRINSAFRTVAQQYLLYEWFQRGRCGITAAATPGRSNHESGRAIDVSNYSAWAAALGPSGWVQTVPGDEVHFDHQGSPDNRGLDVLAFQTLWNRHRPQDVIVADGIFGPETSSRLGSAPADGFGGEPGCSARLSAKRAVVLGVIGDDIGAAHACGN